MASTTARCPSAWCANTLILMPAYQAADTLADTLRAIPEGWNRQVLCDDASTDGTAERAEQLGVPYVLRHPKNRGYGANQKTLYDFALRQEGAEYFILLHPDFQYDPQKIPEFVRALQRYDVVLGSRIRSARSGGMPRYKYWANRGLTRLQNQAFGLSLSEYHTGYRGFRREVLETVAYHENRDDFIFDNQLLAQVIRAGFRIGEVPCAARYFPEASSLGFWGSCRYGLGVLGVTWQYWRVLRLKEA